MIKDDVLVFDFRRRAHRRRKGCQMAEPEVEIAYARWAFWVAIGAVIVGLGYTLLPTAALQIFDGLRLQP
jgi:hypothetical protein